MNAALILSLAAILVSGGYCEADALLLPVASEPSSPDHDGSRKFGSMCVNSWDECVNWPLANLLQGYEADPASSARTIQADSDGKMLREQRSSTVSNRGRQGYLLRTRKSMDELGKGEVRNTRGSYLFRTKKSSSSMPRHRELRGGSYLFRTRKSFNMENADEDLMDAENNEEALEDLGDQVARGHDFGGGNSEDLMQLFNRMARSNKGYLFRTRKSPSDLSNRSQRGGTYLFRT